MRSFQARKAPIVRAQMKQDRVRRALKMGAEKEMASRLSDWWK